MGLTLNSIQGYSTILCLKKEAVKKPIDQPWENGKNLISDPILDFNFREFYLY